MKFKGFLFITLVLSLSNFNLGHAEEESNTDGAIKLGNSSEQENAAKTAVKSKAEETVKPDEDKGYGKVKGLLGPITLGPSITPIALPIPLLVGLEGKFMDILGFGFNTTLMPKLNIQGVTIAMKYWDARLRWFPFRGSFFIGAGYGQESISASMSQSTGSITADINVLLKFTHIDPQLGWKWVWDSGFFMGLDFGYQFVTKYEPSVTVTVSGLPALPAGIDPNQYLQAGATDNPLASTMNTLSKGMPMTSLLNMGWLF